MCSVPQCYQQFHQPFINCHVCIFVFMHNSIDPNVLCISLLVKISIRNRVPVCVVVVDMNIHSSLCFLPPDPPPTIAPPRNVSVFPGDSAVMSCVAISTVPYNITWLKPSGDFDPNAFPRARLFQNGSMLIRCVQVYLLQSLLVLVKGLCKEFFFNHPKIALNQY